jgi:tetratricopeptide (TPR) repeat protein
MGRVYAHLGDYERALECQQQAYAHHQQAGDQNRLVWDLVEIGAMYKNLGRIQDARRYIVEGVSLARQVGSCQSQAYALAHWGSLSLHEGDYVSAARYYQQVIEMQPSLRSAPLVATAEAGLGLALLHLGDGTYSRYWFERALDCSRERGHRRCIAETLILLGLLGLAEGRLEQAGKHIHEGVLIAQECKSEELLAAGLAARSGLERRAGDPICAMELAAGAYRVGRRSGLAGCLMWAEIETGLACLALNNLTEALEHTRRAVDLTGQAGQDWIGHEQAHCALAQVWRALGNEQAALEEESIAQEIVLAKAGLIQDAAQRVCYLSTHNL